MFLRPTSNDHFARKTLPHRATWPSMPTGNETVALTNLSPRLKSVPSFPGASSPSRQKTTILNDAFHPAIKVDTDDVPPLNRSVTFVSITKSLGRPPRNAAHLAPTHRETEGRRRLLISSHVGGKLFFSQDVISGRRFLVDGSIQKRTSA